MDDEDATFACIVGKICDAIKQQPWIVVVYLSLERKMYCEYVNNMQCEGTAVLDAINKISVLLLSMNCTKLCVCRSLKRNVCPYYWRSMRCNQIKTWTVVVYLSLERKMYCEYLNNRQHEGPEVRCRPIKIIAIML